MDIQAKLTEKPASEAVTSQRGNNGSEEEGRQPENRGAQSPAKSKNAVNLCLQRLRLFAIFTTICYTAYLASTILLVFTYLKGKLGSYIIIILLSNVIVCYAVIDQGITCTKNLRSGSKSLPKISFNIKAIIWINLTMLTAYLVASVAALLLDFSAILNIAGAWLLSVLFVFGLIGLLSLSARNSLKQAMEIEVLRFASEAGKEGFGGLEGRVFDETIGGSMFDATVPGSGFGYQPAQGAVFGF